MTTSPRALRTQDIRAQISRARAQMCVICGCSEMQPCDGGCSWSARGLCSTCVQVALATLQYIVSLAPPAHTIGPLNYTIATLQGLLDGE